MVVMKFQEAVGDLWELGEDSDLICITTNGFIKTNGAAVMGRGCALEAKQRYPLIEFVLGRAIKEDGNRCHLLLAKLCSFPVKHNWWEQADLELIERSAKELMDLVDQLKKERVLLPRPGCGNGGLKWDEVKQVLGCLDERITVVTYAQNYL